MLHGNDVSNLNGSLDLKSIVPRPDFVISKVTQDAKFVDKLYADFKSQARQMEILFGGYHYADDEETPDAEASCDFFLEHLGTQQDGEVAALDAELNTGEGGFKPGNKLPWVTTWGRRFIKAKNYKCKLYISDAGIADFQLDHPEVAELFDLWYAYWPFDTTAPNVPPAPSPWKSFKLWQFNADVIDKDRWLGTKEEFMASGQQNSPADDYEAKYWTPIQKRLDDMIANSPPDVVHLDKAFHAAVSNCLTLHKIAHRVEPSA